MPYQLLNQLAGMQMPVFFCEPQEVKLVQQLMRAGYLDGHYLPETFEAKQFVQVDCVTPLGERVQAILEHAGVQTEMDIPRPIVMRRTTAPVRLWSSFEV